jgi:hypothetical protein
VSITMIPADVATAQDESFGLPMKYRLSNTFAGGVYHSDRGGTFRAARDGAIWRAGAAGPRSDNAAAQSVSYTTVESCPGSHAAALAAARWAWALAVCA